MVIAMSLLDILPQFLGDIYGFVISLMNGFVRWVSHQEQFLFKDLSISFLMMLGSYYLVFSGVIFLINRSPKRFIYFLISILLVQNLYFIERKTAFEKDAFIVFHKSRFSILGRREGAEMKLQHNLATITSKEIKAVKSYRIAAHIKNIENVDFKNYINFKGQDILLIDRLGVYQLDKLKEPIVVLQYAPKINLERLIQTLKPSLIIADGSSYKSDINRWETTALTNAIPFHYTGKKGAFILSK